MTTWSGDEALATLAARLLGSGHPRSAVAIVTPSSAASAWVGVDPDADFELGSVSKAITGMLYRSAVERELVAPTTEVGTLLPLAGHGPIASVTLESLATHRSGLPRLPPGMSTARRSWRLWRHGENPYGESLAELLEQSRGTKLGSPRGRYSNLGFALLGHAVAAAEGTHYVELVQRTFGEAFFAAHSTDELPASSLVGASRRRARRDPWVGEGIAPAGGVRASIGTMTELLQPILDGTAPGMSALEPTTNFSAGVRIGAGWITIGRGERSVTWHNGATGGFSSFVGVDRAVGVGVVVLTATQRSVDRAGFALLGEHGAGPRARR